MLFNGIFIHHLCNELQCLAGTRVDKIHQPTKDELVLHLRSRSASYRLLLCINQSRARAGLITRSIENPPQPTMFCMLLRKHLTGAKLMQLSQLGLERILHLDFVGSSEIGEPTRFTLCAEFIGRHANLIVIKEDGTILDAIKRVDYSQGKRAVLPGILYEPPPPGGKAPDPSKLPECESYSCFLENYYDEKDRLERGRQRRAELLKLCETRAARARRKAQAQKAELAQAQDRDHLRVLGELILANRAQLEQEARGASAYRLENYYDENKPITIQADPALGPAQNAQRYFKRYRKAKTAAELLSGLIGKAEAEANYLDSVADLLLRAESSAEIDALRAELEVQGYVKPKITKKAIKRKPLKPIEYISPEGFRILVGRNNLQNDQLSFKTAKGGDLWFHAKDYPGSHVILITEGKTPGERSIEEAAMIAAWHSKARGRAAVDYTPAKALKKPAGAAPGQVIYHTYQSMIASPAKEDIEKLSGGEETHGRS